MPTHRSAPRQWPVNPAAAGIAPTGRETEIRVHDFHDVVDGRIVRTHHLEDWVSWFQQVGSWPAS